MCIIYLVIELNNRKKIAFDIITMTRFQEAYGLNQKYAGEQTL